MSLKDEAIAGLLVFVCILFGLFFLPELTMEIYR